MTAAVSLPTAPARASASLKGTKSTPGRRGSKGSRNSFLHVRLSAPNVRPWNDRRAATRPGRPVADRANLRAASTASAPELLRNVRDRGAGTISERAARKPLRASFRTPEPTNRRRRAWSWRARTTAGWVWPRLHAPWLTPKSRDVRPSTPKRRQAPPPGVGDDDARAPALEGLLGREELLLHPARRERDEGRERLLRNAGQEGRRILEDAEDSRDVRQEDGRLRLARRGHRRGRPGG